MSDIPGNPPYAMPPDAPLPLNVIPVRVPRRSEPSILSGVFRWFGRLFITVSLGINLLVLIALLSAGKTISHLGETDYLTAKKTARDKIAVIHMDGVIMEGLMEYPRKQIEQAAEDESVKAVVLRINSPGGSITASDDLYKRLGELSAGNPIKNALPKPIVVSMASVAASGGYYIAMPAKHIVAERTTITGSIGVYASFPNVAKLAEKYGVSMETIKAGAVKDSGSMFHEMTPQERQLWQDMVDHAYHQFLGVVKEGRGSKLKYPLEAHIPEENKTVTYKDEKGQTKDAPYVRQLADGGIFTADKAKKYGLIDQIGYLDDAIKEAKKLGGLGEDYKVITYDKPRTLLGAFLGAQSDDDASESKVDWSKIAAGLSPRLWYLAPQNELAGIMAAANRGS